ncbi:MAG: potassium-transporting ATPase subunit KdpC [Sphingomonadales bacterium]|nr:MAG: potassium-transporting ATPase subunit KdpC [Sphingomonadales bacterium]
MLKHIRPALVSLALFTALLGIAYPLAIAGVGRALFPDQATGSPIMRDGKVIGSRLIGQQFTRPDYFWGRPSAAGKGYDARASAGSNLGPSSQALADRIAVEAERYGQPAGEIPPDLLTASASGLDPHISPAAARFQVSRVATARGIPIDAITKLVDDHVETPSLGFLGEPRVNVLELNLALDALSRTWPQ